MKIETQIIIEKVFILLGVFLGIILFTRGLYDIYPPLMKLFVGTLITSSAIWIWKLK